MGAVESLGTSERSEDQTISGLFCRAQSATLRFGLDRDVVAVERASQGADVLRVEVHGRGVDRLRSQGQSRSHHSEKGRGLHDARIWSCAGDGQSLNEPRLRGRTVWSLTVVHGHVQARCHTALLTRGTQVSPIWDSRF